LIDRGEDKLSQGEGDKSDRKKHNREPQEQLGPDPQRFVHDARLPVAPLKRRRPIGTFIRIG
jgi:hypothetical protein